MAGEAIGAAGVAIGAANAAQIAREHRARCEQNVADFRTEGASVERMKSYAECVQYLHPDPVSPGAVPYIKGGIVILVLAFIAGAIKGWRDEGDLAGAALMAIMIPLLTACGIGVLLAIIAGIAYVFS